MLQVSSCIVNYRLHVCMHQFRLPAQRTPLPPPRSQRHSKCSKKPLQRSRSRKQQKNRATKSRCSHFKAALPPATHPSPMFLRLKTYDAKAGSLNTPYNHYRENARVHRKCMSTTSRKKNMHPLPRARLRNREVGGLESFVPSL